MSYLDEWHVCILQYSGLSTLCFYLLLIDAATCPLFLPLGGEQVVIINSGIAKKDLVPNTPTSTQISVTGGTRCHVSACTMETIYTIGINLYCSYWKYLPHWSLGHFVVCLVVSSCWFITCCVYFLSVCVHSGREQVSALVENAVSGNSMGTLIKHPSGNGDGKVQKQQLKPTLNFW